MISTDKKIIWFLLLFIGLSVQSRFIMAAANPWEKWDSTTIARANTAAGADYMSAEEKMVILLTNLARHDGPLFVETFLQTYMENRSQTRYSRSLIRDLRKTSGLQAMHPERDLYEVANGHAVESGRTGHSGHRNFDRRFKPLLGKYNKVAENCAYGLEYAMDNVIQLLIDENVRDLGHRKNMLNPEFNSTGVSIQPHRRYNVNCVITYGRKQK